MDRRRRETLDRALVASGVSGRRAEREGKTWYVFDRPDSEPCALGEAEFAAYRRGCRSLTQVEVSGDEITVSRFTNGRPDSEAPRLPSVERRDLKGGLIASTWHFDGHPVSEA